MSTVVCRTYGANKGSRPGLEAQLLAQNPSLQSALYTFHR